MLAQTKKLQTKLLTRTLEMRNVTCDMMSNSHRRIMFAFAGHSSSSAANPHIQQFCLPIPIGLNAADYTSVISGVFRISERRGATLGFPPSPPSPSSFPSPFLLPPLPPFPHSSPRFPFYSLPFPSPPLSPAFPPLPPLPSLPLEVGPLKSS